MLRFADIDLKLISNTLKYQFIENTIWVGISLFCKGYAEANNHLVETKDFNLDNQPRDSPICCFLEVDLDYSHKFHDLHNNYLLAPKNIRLTEDILFEYYSQIKKNNNFS